MKPHKAKEIIKKIFPKKIFYFVRDALYPEKINVLENRLNALFVAHYQNVAAPNISQKTAIRNSEFKVYSKHGGDGILAYIFSKIGATNRTCIEIGIEDGRECNTANLLLHFGWKGLMIDAHSEWVESARTFYKAKLDNQAGNVVLANHFVTAENINQLFVENGFGGEVDLLSIDIDSNDYWVWKAIDVIHPRVVVIEYNASMGHKPITIKYDPAFHYKDTCKQYPLYSGASLAALEKLGKSKGYLLVGCDTHGHDAFFVRNDVAEGKFIALSAHEAFYPNPDTLAKFGNIEKQFDQIKHLDLVRIS